MSVSPAGQLAGNLFSIADSDLESGIGSWAALTNCLTPTQGTPGFTGSDGLFIVAFAAGTVSAVAAGMPCMPKVGYDVSFWLQPQITGRQINLGMNFYTSNGGTFLSSDTMIATTAGVAGSYVPAQATFTPPATATWMVPYLQIMSAALANEWLLADLFYCAPTQWQVLAAWPSSPLSASPLYADMTPWVRADQSITYTRGRADETSTVQAGSCQFTLDNSQPGGWFSPGNPNSPFTGVTVGKRILLSAAEETGAFSNRFGGCVTSLTPGWSGGPALESTVQVQAQDLLAWLARDNELRTMVEEEILLPILAAGKGELFDLADASGSKTASDSSGNACPPLIQHAYGTGGALTFGSGAGIIGSFAPGFTSSPLQSALFAPNSGTGHNMQLEAPLQTPVSGASGFSFGIWYSVSTGFGPNQIVPMSLANSRTGATLLFGYSTTAAASFLGYSGSRLTGSLPSFVACTLPASGLLVCTVSGTTATLYSNGSSLGTLTIPSGVTFDYMTVGGLFGGPDFSASIIGWFGSLNCAFVVPSVLSPTQVTQQWTAGAGQNFGALISTLITNILRYSGIPSSLYTVSTGASNADAYEINGQTPLSMIQLYQQVDGGVFYVSAAGQLVWQDRTARYAAEVTPALTLAAGQYQEDLTFPVSVQFLVDDATFANNNIPGGVRAINTAAVAANGTYPNGDPQSPQTGPYYSLPYNYPANPYGQIANPDVLTDAVNWEVNIYGNPVPRSPNVTVELASQPGGGTTVARSACYACDVGSVIQLNGLPASGPGGTRVNYLMTEGVTETFTRNDSGVTWTLQFNTSPASYSAAWIAGDSNMGVLDSTAVTGRGSDDIAYIGPPYPVPAFSGTMNNTGNVGARDMRGLAFNVQQSVTPPCAVAQQVSLAQLVSNSTNTDVQWDNVWFDGQNGFSLIASNVTYTVRVTGVYLLMATVAWPPGSAGTRTAWFQRNGTVIGTPDQEPYATQTPDGTYIETQVDCAAGDVLKVTCSQSSGGSLTLSTANGGCTFSALWLGL